MEDLNKNQIVLLTLLVSFVTSIATGITTNALLNQAPLEVTRNINRVVEKTIEKVAPTETAAALVGAGGKKTESVVVKEDDAVESSIAKNIKTIVRINEKDSTTGVNIFYGMGL